MVRRRREATVASGTAVLRASASAPGGRRHASAEYPAASWDRQAPPPLQWPLTGKFRGDTDRQVLAASSPIHRRSQFDPNRPSRCYKPDVQPRSTRDDATSYRRKRCPVSVGRTRAQHDRVFTRAKCNHGHGYCFGDRERPGHADAVLGIYLHGVVQRVCGSGVTLGARTCIDERKELNRSHHRGWYTGDCQVDQRPVALAVMNPLPVSPALREPA